MARVICVKKKYGANLPTLMSLHCKCHYNLTMPLMRLLSYKLIVINGINGISSLNNGGETPLTLNALMALVPLMTWRETINRH